MVAKIARFYWLILAAIMLTACGGDPLDDKIKTQQQLTEAQIQRLEKQLERGQIRNANLIHSYADLVAQSQPELTPLLTQLKTDATTDGMLFQGLKDRYRDAVEQPALFPDKQARLNELNALYQAAEPLNFNDLLSDSLNVIADMSKGTLPRVNAEPLAQSLASNDAKDYGAGSQFVGNPNYGSWQTGSNGTSFWAWYGMYSMFSNIMTPRIYYNDWAHHRDYSFYSDHGRTAYRSPKQRNADNQFEKKAKKSFSKTGNYSSPYAKKRSGGKSFANSAVTSASHQPKTKTFRSNSAGKSKYASRSSYSKPANRTKRSSGGFRIKRRR